MLLNTTTTHKIYVDAKNLFVYHKLTIHAYEQMIPLLYHNIFVSYKEQAKVNIKKTMFISEAYIFIRDSAGKKSLSKHILIRRRIITSYEPIIQYAERKYGRKYKTQAVFQCVCRGSVLCKMYVAVVKRHCNQTHPTQYKAYSRYIEKPQETRLQYKHLDSQ